jgi:glucokinase
VTPDVAISIDVGATKVAAALVDHSGAVSQRVQEPLASEGGQVATRQIARLAQCMAAKAKAPARGVGVAVPAVVDPSRREVIWAPNIRGWKHVALADAVERAVRLPTWLEYDGHAATLGEQWLGAGRGVRNFVMLVIGTGIGGGMVLDGRLYRGADCLAGAAGWLTSGACATQAGQPALENAASGPALARRVGVAPNRAEAVFAAAAGGDTAAQRALEEVADRIGLALADVVSLLNPDLVILGGGVYSASSASRLLPRIRRAVRQHSQPVAARRARVVRSHLRTNAGLIGAAHGVFVELGQNSSHESGR